MKNKQIHPININYQYKKNINDVSIKYSSSIVYVRDSQDRRRRVIGMV